MADAHGNGGHAESHPAAPTNNEQAKLQDLVNQAYQKGAGDMRAQMANSPSGEHGEHKKKKGGFFKKSIFCTGKFIWIPIILF